MKLLLDTHVWLWALLQPSELNSAVAQELEDPNNELWLSPISVWETLILAEKGRLELDAPVERWIEEAQAAFPLRDASLTRAVAVVSRRIDVAHQDPADRFIAASALVHDLVLVTRDERLLASTSYQALRA